MKIFLYVVQFLPDLAFFNSVFRDGISGKYSPIFRLWLTIQNVRKQSLLPSCQIKGSNSTGSELSSGI
jgi:hypothetical protein